MRPAITSEGLADLGKMSPNKLGARTKDGKMVYTFADPGNCHCFYVGGPNEYSEYQRLKVKKEIASRRRGGIHGLVPVGTVVVVERRGIRFRPDDRGHCPREV
jgi:hypothetical protein